MSVVPEELFKRRRNHNNTPKSVLLILTNYVVVLVGTSLFTSCNKISNFFWFIIAGLVAYNYFNIRRYHEEYNKVTVIAYVVSMVILIGVFIIYIATGQNC